MNVNLRFMWVSLILGFFVALLFVGSMIYIIKAH